VPEPVQGDLTDDGDRGGVDELRDVGPDGGEPDDGVPGLVDDEAARPV
jgi:hypothetical protein